MLLQPRKVKYKFRHKRRRLVVFQKNLFAYGNVALVLLSPLRVSSKTFFRLKLFLKRSTKKPDITRRLVWLALFPHLPLSKKSKGMRMGKGVGKLSTWYALVPGGTFLLEFKNLRKGRATYYAQQVASRLPVPTQLQIDGSHMHVRLIGSYRVHYSILPFY